MRNVPATAADLIDEALRAPFTGWDFSWLAGRMREMTPPWDYAEEVRAAARHARRLLDVDTGGGEVLARIVSPETFVVATEGHPPNVTVARNRLGPLGIGVVHATSAPDNVEQDGSSPLELGSSLPFRDRAFELVVDRHSSYWPGEIHRVLRAGGRFLTQQRSEAGTVGEAWSHLFDRPEDRRPRFDLSFAVRQLRAAGFHIDRAEEADTPTVFFDTAAVVYYLKAVPWAVDAFDPSGRDRIALERIHDRLVTEGQLVLRGSSLMIDARAG